MTELCTHETVVIHRVFRREAALLLRLVTGTAPGDVSRAAQVAEAVRDYAAALHHHQQVEDELIWPRLYERARLYTELVDRMEMQHLDLHRSVVAVGELLPRWTVAADGGVRDDLAAALAEHRTVLVEHLTEEEDQILPLVEDHLTAAEWDEVTRRGLEDRHRARPALGAILAEATDEERRYLLSKAPVTGRLLWRLVGRHRYDRRMDRLRGPLRGS